ncbi:Voltage-dependent T-type calcium channel subunit alpha-1H [Myotis brandtii]|uniref:Voltage-dependent T-type calcium channel subunit alpha-1H n=1 Tax=Myotis brandtii TaxID=109478 RepID=S7N060_MYOBR|nr:Voltage-dependent T-type calcium channel subunit alpha-1H [Myotis brandtii]
MFRPVAPASAPHPHPLQEVEMETYVGTTSGLTSVEHVPPVESCASLQALPTASSPARGNQHPLTLPPRGTARSPSFSRLLCRQPECPTTPRSGSCGPQGPTDHPSQPQGATLGWWCTRLPRPSSVPSRVSRAHDRLSLLGLQPFALHGPSPCDRHGWLAPACRVVSRVAWVRRCFIPRAPDDRVPSHLDHILSLDSSLSAPPHPAVVPVGLRDPQTTFLASVPRWAGGAQSCLGPALCPAGFPGPMTGSPYSGCSPLLLTAPPLVTGMGGWHPHAEWSPGWHGGVGAYSAQEALHTNSLEAQADGPADCGLDSGEPDGKTPTRQASLGDSLRRPEPGEVKAPALEAEPALGSRRKKKMSPPCISIDPPVEDEGAAWPPAAEGGSTTLRRRTPSCEPMEGLGVDPTSKGERWGQVPCRAEHLTIPSFAFEPLDVGDPSGDLFSDSGHRVAPEPRASSGVTAPAEPHETESPMPSSDPHEKGWGLYLNVPESPPKKAGSPPASPTPGDSADEPV